jgi:hypothetical protein
MERSHKEWQALVAQFKSRISTMKVLVQSEYEQMEKQKKASAEVRKADSKSASQS